MSNTHGYRNKEKKQPSIIANCSALGLLYEEIAQDMEQSHQTTTITNVSHVHKIPGTRFHPRPHVPCHKPSRNPKLLAPSQRDPQLPSNLPKIYRSPLPTAS